MASKEDPREQFLGKTLDDIPTPAAILDLAKVELNCQRMLDTVKKLGIGWRAHIKTHKVCSTCVVVVSVPRPRLDTAADLVPHTQTTELTRLQVGDGESTPVNIVVSTLIEAENILPLLREYRSRDRAVNVSYGSSSSSSIPE